MPASCHLRISNLLILNLLGGLVFAVASANAAETNSPTPAARYETRVDHDPNGLGKFFLGREIAQVMGHEAADWLERPGREKKNALTCCCLHSKSMLATQWQTSVVGAVTTRGD